jgi:amino acid adenylation domain-containing protein
MAAPPLVAVSRDSKLPLSFAQQRLWFLDQLEPGSDFYNLHSAVRLSGKFNVSVFEEALSEIVRRHEILRTTFASVGGEPVQVISSPAPLRIPVAELDGLGEAEREEEVKRLINEEAQKPFDLNQGPLLRIKLLKLTEDDHIVLLTMHHIISDGWSMGVLFGEIAALYQAYEKGEKSPLDELPAQYADFAVWQREWLRGEALEANLSYWRGQLGGELPSLELPIDRPRPPVQTYKGAVCGVALPDELSEGLRVLSQRHGCTLYMTLLAAFQTLLYRHSGQEDIIVGSPIAGRNRAELEPLIGFFINTLVLRTDLSGEPTFVELMKRVRETTLAAYTHQDVPFEKLVEELHPERDMSRSPLFQVDFTFQHFAPVNVKDFADVRMTPLNSEGRTAKFDLTLSLAESGKRVFGTLEYNTDLFDASTVERLISHFEQLLSSCVENSQERVNRLRMLSEAEHRQLLIEWSAAEVVKPREACVQQLFEEQAERTPDAPALSFEGQQLSYGELNARANQLAHYLRTIGVGAEVPVGICVERSVEMIVGLLAILKAGGAYVPLDPAYPRERLSFMLDDAGVAVLLTQQHLLERLPTHWAYTVCVDADWETIAGAPNENPARNVLPESLAYIIYTSGSTGTPKGVSVSHRAITTLAASRDFARLDSTDVLLQLAPLAFDASTFEIWGALLNGARLVVFPPVPPTLDALGETLRRQRITTLWLTAGLFHLMVDERPDDLAAVRQMLAGGDVLSVSHVRKFLERAGGVNAGAVLVNGYGPTECTTFASCNRVSSADELAGAASVAIGRPVAGREVFVLDASMEPVPAGVQGELYIGGAGLGRGYVGRAALTAEKFVPHPFGAGGERLYRTGDTVRWRVDGELEFVGRVDGQVKLRGYRVELGEIESVLMEHGEVREAVVVVRADEGGDKRLVAYLTSANGEGVRIAELRGYLEERLPGYMMPSAFVVLDELPLTSNGKVDRRALPAPEKPEADAPDSYDKPESQVEEILAGVWADVLKLERVSGSDNFFDLGGHSLLATQVISRLREVFDIELPLRVIFENPTVGEMALAVEIALRAEQGVKAPPVRPRDLERQIPLSFAQQRLWFFDQLEPGNAFYNVPLAVQLRGRLSVEALEKTLSEVIRRHEVLRTTFAEVEGEPVQLIGTPPSLQLAVEQLEAEGEEERKAELLRVMTEEGRKPFDLSQGPLIRMRLIRLEEEEHVILLTMHHIVSDGWSMGILVNEVATLYRAYAAGEESPLPELPLQYADFAVWQRDWLSGEVLERELSYWRRQLGGKLPVLELPTDRPRTNAQSYRGAYRTFTLPKELSDRILQLGRREGCTLYMTLLASFHVLLQRYTGQDDIIVGSPVAGRNRTEIEPLIGFFINSLAMRANLSGDPPFNVLLRQVKEATLGAYAHQDVPFEKLVEELQPERAPGRAPIFQVTFGVQNAPAGSLEVPGLSLRMLNLSEGAVRYDLTLWAYETPAGLVISWSYSTDLFDRSTIDRMQGHYETLLSSIVAEPEAQLSALEMLTGEERQLRQEKEQERQQSRLTKFRNVKPKPVRVEQPPPSTD